jgi:hypothetical protein
MSELDKETCANLTGNTASLYLVRCTTNRKRDRSEDKESGESYGKYNLLHPVLTYKRRIILCTHSTIIIEQGFTAKYIFAMYIF